MKATLMTAILGASGGEALAGDYKENPFTLIYEGAITKNEPCKVNIHPVKYKLNGLDIAANVYPGELRSEEKISHGRGGASERRREGAGGRPVCPGLAA